MAALDWSKIDTVLLDMDGTLLDLHYDNHFWLDHLPQRYAELRGVSREAAEVAMGRLYDSHAGTLNWYCLDFWSRELGLPIRELKRETAERIQARPGALAFLEALRQAGKRVVLITNAHPDVLSLKLEKVALAPWFERLISAHEYGHPKESQSFWQALRADIAFNPATALFIDDTLPILRSARAFGIRHLLAVKAPDSRKPDKNTEEFDAVDGYPALISGLEHP
ncbi:GMP/IMP nucleotidase [Pseudomonas typographi]|uniref:GMP/IMP nucleotidase n=1 Tax=Pseudomonas typographi TaxID=2715964 RepID=UPI00168A39FB|nr:GMP/IMP nucleotidase [Pseudomonas typographi]MBD1586120.1 GMP/IMP nucleotidase [Pseudomonas typographi]